MKRINMQATFLAMLAIPIISEVDVWFAYLYITIFMLSIGWERSKNGGR